MKHIEIERNDRRVNAEKLHEELSGVLADTFIGVSENRQRITLHLTDEATPAQLMQARETADNHDAAQKTARQQAQEREQQEHATLKTTFEADFDPVDTKEFNGVLPADTPRKLKALAKIVATQNAEIIELRRAVALMMAQLERVL